MFLKKLKREMSDLRQEMEWLNRAVCDLSKEVEKPKRSHTIADLSCIAFNKNANGLLYEARVDGVLYRGRVDWCLQGKKVELFNIAWRTKEGEKPLPSQEECLNFAVSERVQKDAERVAEERVVLNLWSFVKPAGGSPASPSPEENPPTSP